MQYVGMTDSRISTADIAKRRTVGGRGTGSVQTESQLTPEQRKAKDVCTQFEALLVKQMLAAMQSSIKMFGDGFGGDYFQGMFQDAIAQKVAEQGLGLGKMLYEQIMRNSVGTGKNGATAQSGADIKV